MKYTVKPPIKNYPTNKIVYNNNDEIWSIDLAELDGISGLLSVIKSII